MFAPRMARPQCRRVLRQLAAELTTASEAARPQPGETLSEAGTLEDGVPLNREQIRQFLVEGYVALPGLLDTPDGLNERLCRDSDRLAADKEAGSAGQVVSYEELGKLCSLPRVVGNRADIKLGGGGGPAFAPALSLCGPLAAPASQPNGSYSLPIACTCNF
jgi:hypothetical protein